MNMRAGLLALALSAVVLTAAVARAEEADLPRSPGAALGAAAINVVYFPVRFALSTVWACVSGATGWLTGGNQAAFDDVWHVAQGSAYVTPGMLTQHEHFRFGNWESGH